MAIVAPGRDSATTLQSTGATAGSVLGAMLGAQNLPAKWINPLHNRIRSMVVGYDDIAITDVADMAYEVNRKLRR